LTEAVAAALNGRLSGGHDPVPVVAVSSSLVRMRACAYGQHHTTVFIVGQLARKSPARRDDYEERSAVLN
jgi:hypothetical protein